MILFLDFDGVLHPVRSNIDDIFCRTPLLDQFLIHEMPEWRIVLSTSWREPHSMDELLDFIPESLHHRILGTTVPDNILAHARWTLCYFSARPAKRRFCIISKNAVWKTSLGLLWTTTRASSSPAPPSWFNAIRAME